MDTIRRQGGRVGAAVRARVRWPIVLACVAVLLVPAFAGADQLEELKNSIRQGVSDAMRKGSDSARKAVDPASGTAVPPAGQPANPPPPKAKGAHAPADAQSVPPASARSSSACTSLQPAERPPFLSVTNTCNGEIYLLLADSGGRCAARPVHAGGTTSVLRESTIRGVCRRTAVPLVQGSCTCPAGTEVSGEAAAERVPVAGDAPATAAPAPSTAAQESNPGLFGGVLAAITKNSSNAVQNEIDRTVNQATGGSGGSVSGSSGGSSSGGSSTGSGGYGSKGAGSAALVDSGPSHASSAPGTLTQAEIEYLTKSDYEQCAIHTTYLKNLHDCTCRSEAYKQVLNAKRSKTLSQEELNQRGQICPAPKATTYAWVYQTCDDFMQHKRTDHAQFCGCTAERFSSTFHERPDSNLRKVEALRKNSMVACGLSDKSHNIHGAK